MCRTVGKNSPNETVFTSQKTTRVFYNHHFQTYSQEKYFTK